MIWQHITRRLRAFRRDETGSTLVELSLVISLFLLLFFGLLDFGRMGYRYVAAEKAMQVATRIATVRPPACAGVPATHVRGPVSPSTTPLSFGTNCSAAANVCLAVATVTCTGDAGNATAVEIWDQISGVLPAAAEINNVQFSYSYDANLGFLGGPYVPMVTVELVGLNFQFATPLSGLAALAAPDDPTNTATVPSGSIPFPNLSVSMPAEDLNLGDAG